MPFHVWKTCRARHIKKRKVKRAWFPKRAKRGWHVPDLSFWVFWEYKTSHEVGHVFSPCLKTTLSRVHSVWKDLRISVRSEDSSEFRYLKLKTTPHNDRWKCQKAVLVIDDMPYFPLSSERTFCTQHGVCWKEMQLAWIARLVQLRNAYLNLRRSSPSVFKPQYQFFDFSNLNAKSMFRSTC